MNENQELPPLPEAPVVYLGFGDTQRRGYTADQMHAYARAALVAKAPAGWKLVPVEPTEDMLFAAEMSKPRHYRDLWAAMLAATPPAPAQAQQAKPLSEAEIERLNLASRGVMSVRDLARIVELAHGIGASTKESGNG